MMVDPCSNHPISWPLRNTTRHWIGGDEYRLGSTTNSRKRRRMPATRMAATGTSDALIVPLQHRAYDNALILTVKAFNTSKRDWIDVPGIAPDVRDLLHEAIVRSMKAVIHSGGQSQGNVASTPIEVRELGIYQQ